MQLKQWFNMKKTPENVSIEDLGVSELSALREMQRIKVYAESQKLKLIDEVLISKRNPETLEEGEYLQ